MLRGAQTPGQLKQRAERLHDFESLPALHETLDRLVERGLVARHPRRPGQKEDRYEHLLGSGADDDPGSPPAAGDDAAVEAEGAATTQAGGAGSPTDGSPAEDRLERIEREVAELRSQLESLRAELGGG
jgi:uncharacterized protein YceH (UPF0502 family)